MFQSKYLALSGTLVLPAGNGGKLPWTPELPLLNCAAAGAATINDVNTQSTFAVRNMISSTSNLPTNEAAKLLIHITARS
jgi:hypothetical protein